MAENFTAFVIEDVDGKPKGGFTTLTLADLPDNDVLVEVACSTLNYKDGLAVSGKGRIARKLPMVAGIDLAGTVVESRSPAWKPGDKVVANGWGLSETQWGGYTRFQRLKAEWLTRLPDAFSFEEAMGIGTAGYTAALCVDALERWGAVQPGGKEVLVTGAAGGVGSVAVALLAKRGYPVVASTGRPETHDYLRSLGASGFIDRAALLDKGAPLQKERWAGGVDSVGGQTLVNALSQTVWGGAIAACGLAGSSDLPGSVLPHILRNVALLGVDSVMAPQDRRDAAWARLARDLDRNALKTMYEVQPFDALPELATRILAGKIRGRVVVDVTR
ncbi:oxidoreductase (plasmid) [Azospirillum baldaniorum]|uniref:Dehydrogenase, NAD(P)-binding domain and GroES-like domain n=1 Tax=Azospirillum baldaniorum TaxID=1064539 RepID=A0A9P1NQR9_9PROT|nr:MDR family oxidoreductase [Azospirillum baldaniorum]TWA76130.1 acrylyl-CoA reductase (NADPH) [Azospirillum brasilense]AWJ93103.1 oxidoreductase [Azospirillum baldaniorum]NUB07661.1 oxidoreductase [Azospirillum baldaniorum]TWA61975.1 acrylyl-CoA reductase (NADPH) [Azospirillum baldaniorum]CCD02302.1 putative dehydrogenase, NAD(P)-binding domain and GroES-like domain [Azospirillum baldaniorum]